MPQYTPEIKIKACEDCLSEKLYKTLQKPIDNRVHIVYISIYTVNARR